MKMSMVERCEVENCAYNIDRQCHALAITVGDTASNPKCDTYFLFSSKGGNKDTTAGVGACKAAACTYNKDLECFADKIQVGFRQEEVDCLTFRT